ncbi:DoxX family membrane protein [Telmatobacter sp. DSM 110680]|uniref:DoxX family membrane protein n=1 Tax=Telmatobacter sp. DSM 110680 TaxID=3036704 RepID=A0AAU7DN99_9BACT
MMPSAQPILKFESRSASRSILQSEQQPSLALLAIGLLGLGVLGLAVGDFAMVWQPVAPWFPARTALAYAAGALMIGCGAGLMFRATTTWAVRILFPYLIVWQLLKLPSLFVAPKLEAVYLGFGELAVLLAGGWILFARLGDVQAPWLAWATGDRGVRLARYYFAIWIIPIGLSHLIYTKATMELVPAWLPYHLGWAYLTGAGQIASGLGVLFGVLPRIAASAEAAQITLYTLLIWLPAIFATPRARLPWTALWISWTIGAAAWVVAQNTWSKATKR